MVFDFFLGRMGRGTALLWRKRKKTFAGCWSGGCLFEMGRARKTNLAAAAIGSIYAVEARGLNWSKPYVHQQI